MDDFAEKEFDADVNKLPDVLSFLDEALSKHDASMKASMALDLAVEEAFVNIAYYAYEKGRGKAWVCLRFEKEDVIITLKDQGVAFDPLAKEDPDIKAEANDRQIGGLGILMIKKSVDECRYQRKDGYNILTLRKSIV